MKAKVWIGKDHKQPINYLALVDKWLVKIRNENLVTEKLMKDLGVKKCYMMK